MAGKKLLYEISTRSWIRQYGETATLADVPLSYWQSLADKGFHFIWLMGVWKTTEASIEAFCFHPDLEARYTSAQPNWEKSDVLGSPYAIDDYILQQQLGSIDDLKKVHEQINEVGMKLILDFVPNHFNAFSRLIESHPDCFLQGHPGDLEQDPSTYYHYHDRIYAHGRDPYFPAWTDTVQVDYSKTQAHELMTSKLHQIALHCDGVRCDMAMLVLPDIFSHTWSKAANMELNFWATAIKSVKERQPFLFIAEAYWDRESDLQDLGFDYTYDKHLLDLLVTNNLGGLEHHLRRDKQWHRRAVSFLENHDEDRSMKTLGLERSRSGAALMMTMPGMSLIFDGQLEGFRERVPVQLARESKEYTCPCPLKAPVEIGCACQENLYVALLEALKTQAFRGEWSYESTAEEGTFLFYWCCQDSRVLVAINHTAEQRKISTHYQLGSDILNQNESPNYVERDPKSTRITLAPFRAAVFNVE